jgi:carbon-monoxide dehydrogenase large subunit
MMSANSESVDDRERIGLVGTSLLRLEDERLLRGAGRFVDDLRIPGALSVAFVRSICARARITAIDATAARALPGVVAVYTWDDIVDDVERLVLEAELRVPEIVRERVRPVVRLQPLPLLAEHEVTHVGQPVAMVVATDRYVAEDAAELVEVDYETMVPLIDPLEAVLDTADPIVPGAPDNVPIAVHGSVGDVDAALATAHAVVRERYESHRYVASPLEPRGVVAVPDPLGDGLTVYASSQTVHRLRDIVAQCLRMPLGAIRVVSPDMGGGFGQKGIQYVEDVLIPYAARALGRPVTWTEDRIENLTSSAHAREQVHDIVLACDGDGRIVALRDDVVINLGSANLTGLVVPYNTLSHLLGPYVIPNIDISVRGVVTNTMFATPYRGAGRPEAVFAMERAMDRLARMMGIEPWELRRRNLVPTEAMPYETGLLYRDGTSQTYDSGDFPALLERAVDLSGIEEIRQRQREHECGERIGIGFAMYIEGTGLGPFESGSVSVLPSGRVRIATGATSQGQAHSTVFAQVVAERLGVAVDQIDLIGGDTAAIAHGVGTIASRSMVTAGNAFALAADTVRQRLLDLAAERLEADPGDLEIVEGVVAVRGMGGRGVPIGELAASQAPALQPSSSSGAGATVSETAYFKPPSVTVASAAHVAIVSVDEETGVVRVLRYVVVHDCGRIVNPLVADGQVTGGVMQGIGGALYEEMVIDEDGQPKSATFMDYLLPTASETPEFVLDHLETPSPLNPLGVKGLGEGGAIAPPAAVANAIEDALAGRGIHLRRGPFSPSRVLAALREADIARQ